MVKKLLAVNSWLILIFLVLVWGSSFILMKKCLVYYSHTEVALLRISITFLFMLPFAIHTFKRLNTKKYKAIAISGIIGNGIPAFLFAKAQTGIDSSLAGILNSLTPLFALIVGLLFFKSKAFWYNITGIFIGLVGTVGLMTISGGKTLESNFSYGIFIIVATLLYAINANVIGTFLKDTDSLTITSYAFTTIGIPAILGLLFFTDFTGTDFSNPQAVEGLIYVSILAIVGSGISMILYNKLIKTSGVLFAASVTYLMPVVAVLWGIIDGEKFGLVYLLWISIILVGVFMVNYQKRVAEKNIE